MYNWLKSKFSRATIETANIPISKAYDLLVDNPSLSGVHVSDRKILGNPAIFRGLNILASRAAKLDLCVYRYGDNNSREKATTLKIYQLLKYAPNELQTPFVWKHCSIWQALLGNSYTWINRDEFGVPQELILLDKESTWVEVRNGQVEYVTHIGQTKFHLRPEDVLHFRGLGNNVAGYEVCDILKDALGLGLALQGHGSSYFKSNVKTNVYFELPNTHRDVEKAKAFRAALYEMHQGMARSFAPGILPPGTKVTEIDQSNEEGQWLESRQHDLVMSANITGVPASKVGSQVNVSYGSLEADELAMLNDSLDGILTMFEQELENKLLSERQKTLHSHYINFNRKQLVQIDAKTEVDLLVQQLNNGVLSWEEVREILDLPTDKIEDQEWRRPHNIQVEGEEPEEPPQEIPPTAPELPQDEPEQPEAEEDTRAKQLLQITLQRLVNRLQKNGFKPDDIPKHRAVWLENLEPFANSTAIWERIEDELTQVLPEQRDQVLAALDTQELTEELWNIGT